jgi:tetratricopeptide (TPR) repeat protein
MIVVHHYQKVARDYIALLTALIKENPDEISSYIQRGADYIKTGNYYNGILDYEEYIKRAREKRKEYHGNIDAFKLISGQIAHSFIEIGRAKMKMKYPSNEVIDCLLSAVAEASDMREAWCYLADGWMSIGNYASAYAAAINAMSITHSGIYAKETICWGDYPKKIADSAYSKVAQGILFDQSFSNVK